MITQYFNGLSVQAVAEVTGLSRGEIYRVAGILDLGAPAHFTYQGTGVVYSLLGLVELADGMEELGHGVGAAALRMVVANNKPAPLRLVESRAHWLAPHEERQEGAA